MNFFFICYHLSVSLTVQTFQDLFIQKFLKLPCIHFVILSNKIKNILLVILHYTKPFHEAKKHVFFRNWQGCSSKMFLCFTITKTVTKGIFSSPFKQPFVAAKQWFGAQRYYLVRKLMENHSLIVVITYSFHWRVLKNSGGWQLYFVTRIVVVLLEVKSYKTVSTA